MRISRLLIDAGYEWNVVTSFCRRSKWANVLIPSKGEGITAAKKPISDYSRTQGDRIGFNWWVPKAKTSQQVRHLRFDSNYWKTFAQMRLMIPQGGLGSLMLCGNRPIEHEMLSSHLVGESPVKTFGHGRQLIEWKAIPNMDVHLLDCLVGCLVGASYSGAITHPTLAQPKKINPVRRRGSVTYL